LVTYQEVAGVCVVVVSGAATVWQIARRRNTETPRERRSRVEISQRATEHIRNRGNAVYVVGRGRAGQFAFLRATTERPAGVEFTQIAWSPVEVFLDDSIDPLRLEIGLLWWTRRLTVDGGLAAGGDGGG
jgi:hypothetical protein